MASALFEQAQRRYVNTPLTYMGYLLIERLLGLQRQLSSHPAELFFIVIHQAHELWFKVILQDIDRAKKEMFRGRVDEATALLRKAVEIMRLLVHQIDLLQTLTPADFLAFRERLRPASGFESVQFREIEFVLGMKDPARLEHYRATGDEAAVRILARRLKRPDLRVALYALLKILGYAIPANAARIEAENQTGKERERTLRALRQIYRHPKRHATAYLLCETLLDLDHTLALWRNHHVLAVSRLIGIRGGTGGTVSGTGYLRSTVDKRAFPLLWAVRTIL